MDFRPIQSDSAADHSITGTMEPHDSSVPAELMDDSKSATSSTLSSLCTRLPWLQITVLGLILVLGLCVGQIAKIIFDPEHAQHTFVGRILIDNAATLFVGLGVATWGCILNRHLQRKIHDQKQLGPYTLLRLIGSGGMGDVYLAEHQLLKRRCAVKLIRKDRAADRRTLERFEREVQFTAQLTHWNTVQVYDYGRTTNGTFYYAMEYLQGLNLRQLVEQFGQQPPGRVVYILRQLCGALHEAYASGLVHRDIKPSNIFLAERGNMHDVAKLLDFGLVRNASLGSNSIRRVDGRLQGSPRFMCPEQACGQKPDSRGDLYSLAVVGYYLLTGRTPFEDDNPIFLVLAHATVPAPVVHDMGIEVPQDLSDIIMKCLSKNPDDRFQNPRELLAALEQCACATDWTWRDAERWWTQNSNPPQHDKGKPAVGTHEALPVSDSVAPDCDTTVVSDDKIALGRIF
ncbi:MAG TPA: serine/threonine-protein kinase [Planctomycetaceae bacterium]|nr:serine/threonine-protein kinase [Planctomycetaceae bacterium]